MANEVKIVVTASKRTDPLLKAKDEVKDLKREVNSIPDQKTVRVTVKDDGVTRATEQLRAAMARQEDQAGRLRVAEERLAEVRKNAKATDTQKAAAEEAVGKAYRATLTAADNVANAERRLANARAAAQEQAARANAPTPLNMPDIGGAFRRVGGQAGGELKSAGMVAGAQFAAGIGAGISSVGAAGMFVGIAAAAQSSVPEVAETYSGLWNRIKNEAKNTSSVLADDFIASADKLGATFNRLAPEMERGFVAAQQPVADLTDGLSRMATAALPGIVTAAESASDVTDDMAVAMERAGRGVSNFFTESSQASEAAGDSFAEFGKIVERLGSFGGRVLADLANSGKVYFPALTGAVDATATAVESLAHSALPALAGGAAMSLNGLTLLMHLANTLIGVLGPLAPAISNVATSLKLVDMVSFGGVGRSWDTFKANISDAPNLTGKIKAGFSGLLTTLGPVGIAAGLFGIALDKIGASQQRAAERQNALTNAFRQSKGAIDENVRATVAKNLADDGLLKKGKDLGLSSKTLVDAWLGQGDAIDTVKGKTQEYLKEVEGQGQLEGQVAQGQDSMSQKAYDVARALDDQSSEVHKAADEGKLYAEAMETGADATDKLAASAQKLHEQLLAMVDKELGYRIAVDATKDAQNAASEAMAKMEEERKKHGTGSKEYKDAENEYGDSLRGVETAMLQQANAARELGVAQSTASSDVEKAADGQRAYAKEVISMAAAAGESAPSALRQMVAGLTESELAALGATRQIGDAGKMVYNLPGGKTMTIAADDQASWKALYVQQQLAGLKDKFIQITVRTVYHDIYEQSRPGSQPFSQGRLASGGAVPAFGAAGGGARGSLTRVNEQGPELVRMQDGALRDLQYGTQVIPAGQSAQIMAAAAGGQGAGWGGGGPVAQINLMLDRRVLQSVMVDLTRDFVAARGGNVQNVLGR